jgi:hypothetical protein
MPVSMVILRPQRRASYSDMLFDAGKWRRTAYLMCSPKGETKSRPAPAPVFITDPSVVWTSLGPLPQWVPGPTTRWAPRTTRLALHGT